MAFGLLRQLGRDRKRAPSPERDAEDLIIGRRAIGSSYCSGSPAARCRGTNQRLIDPSAEWLAEGGELGASDPERINYSAF